MKFFLYPILILACFQSFSQVTLYSENFSDASNDNKGQDGLTYDITGITNWTIDLTGGSFAAGDHFKQTNGYFESKDTDAQSSNPVEWFSLSTNINSYSNVTVSVDLTRNESASTSGVQAYYQVDALGWVSFGSLIGSGAQGTFTANGLSGNTIQIRIDHWGTFATPSYRHDNVTIVGTPPSCGASTASTSLVLTPTATTMDISWADPTTGDGVVVVMREASNPASPPLFNNAYSGNLNFTTGDEIGTSNNFVLYSGNLATNIITASGLEAGIEYSVEIYSMEIAALCYFSTPITADATTLCGGFAPSTGPARFRTCNIDRGTEVSNDGALSFNILVEGSYVGTALDATSGPNLRNIRVKLNGDATDDINGYTCTLTAPDGTTSLVVFGLGSFTNNVANIDAQFRDNNLLRVASYSTYTTMGVEPFNQGYYRVVGASGFNVFNGVDPRGNWTITFTESLTSTNDDYLLDFVELEFATPYPDEIDVTTLGDNCSDAILLSNGVYYGSTVGKTPEAIDPKDNTSGCDGITGCGCWNGAKNNSQWFTFFATRTDVEISISGMEYNAIEQKRLQAVMVEASPTACSGESNWTVRSCPEFSDGGNSYNGTSGTHANIDLSFTAIPGQQYYFIIDGSAGANGNYIIYADGVLPNVPLPVSLLDFKAKLIKEEVDITWITESETNNSHFHLQKSTDGYNFQTINTLSGAGNSSSTLRYQSFDYNPVNGLNYYRLKQVDFDGQFEYSKIAVVNYRTTAISLYPSVIDEGGVVNISGVANNSILEIFNLNGQLIQTENLQGENNVIQINLPKGMYLLRCLENDIQTTKKLVVR